MKTKGIIGTIVGFLAVGGGASTATVIGVNQGQAVQETGQKQSPKPEPKLTTYKFDFNGNLVNLECPEGYLPHEDADWIARNNMPLTIVCRKKGGSYHIAREFTWSDFSNNLQKLRCSTPKLGDTDYKCDWRWDSRRVVAENVRANRPITDSSSRQVIRIVWR
ncbi:hypothetical protein MHLP_01170 [Candidatus Mycoplasma haematolamae str. Purdue]|uniref:Uncharacterized protein n=1 Tax=Mycoplasma haematolamae (strain Purdue) TaxID=1212765 RepID=I7CIW5_MYCHA|nr:hypothetical protein [Candidatus Mycoplasma haematolamae]AFO51814.1 hypothetical protein MHLP_01170 [Candidatus Mycoplasma haematolamae str. Purdue]